MVRDLVATTKETRISKPNQYLCYSMVEELEIGINYVKEAVRLSTDYFVNPTKRVYWLYLISSFALAFFVFWRSKRRESFVQYVFNNETWFGNSARVDYSIIVFNSFVKLFLISQLLYLGPKIQFYISDYLSGYYGFPRFIYNRNLLLLTYTVVLVIVNDLFIYLVHLAFHKIPFLWNFHKVHHSATTMNPMTQYRLHPVELIANNLRRLVVYGSVTGVFYYLANYRIHTVTFIGVNIFTFLFNFLGSSLRHSHVKLKYFSWLENILISPFQHQIHHSDNEKHFDKNLGSKFAIWDKLFGTLLKSKDVGKITFGLGKENPAYQSFSQNIFSPLWKWIKK